jgi:hypothetical protein
VPVHGGDVGFGDVKHVWELSRHQFLIDIAKSWFLTRNHEDVEALRRLVRGWIADNPYGTGVNWSCALEPAFRTFSWLWAYALAADGLDDDFHVEWLASLLDHGRFIERHFEHYSSPYNHLIGEAAALYMLGAYLPEFEEAARWRATATTVLTSRLGEQFYADGGSVEQSTFYHHATLGFYLLAGLLARATGDDLSPAVWAAIERALDFSVALSQPDGKTPPIGGADDGKPIRMEHLPFWDFRPYLAIGAVVFNRPDFKQAAGRFYEDALWLLGPKGRAHFEGMAAEAPRHASISMPSSGYYILRSRWAPDADYVCFDCGEQAAGMRPDGVPNSMHGHADCLSVIAWLHGRRVLVDPGFFAYNCGGEWEAHFRETAAHNTATVDRRDQARHIRKMAWSHSYRATLDARSETGNEGWVVGSHDGFARGPHGVIHRRAVWLRPDSYLLIHDEFVGTGEHELAVTFQFAPGELDLMSNERALFDKGVDLLWLSRESWRPDARCGGPSPSDGWIAPSLGVRVPAPRLRLTCRTGAPRASLLTVLAARVRPACGLSIVKTADTGDAAGALAAIRTPRYTDIVAAAGVAPAGLFETDAPLAVSRVGADGTVETIRAAGSRLHVDADRVRRLLRLDSSSMVER